MENNLIKRKILYLIPFIALFGFMLFQNMFVGYSHDDITFRGFINQYPSLIAFCDFRYHCWTNRNLIECLIIIFLKNNLWLWRIIDALIYSLIAYLIIKLINKEKDFKYSLICCILVAIFYLSVKTAIESTGFLTTSINYTWPFLALLIHFYILKEIIFKNKVKGKFKVIFIHLICIASLIFAGNNEQLAMVILGVYVFAFIYAIYNKIPIPKITYLYLAILFITIANALICPGNYNRINVALRYYPWYESLGILDKLNIGISNILNSTITNCGLITAITFGLLGIYNYINNKTRLKQIIGFIPLIIVIIFWISAAYYPALIDLICVNITKTGYHPVNIYSFIIYAVFIISLIYTYITLYKYNKKLGYVVTAITLIGLGSAIMYGFTPTILSKERMYIFTSACSLIIDCLLIWNLTR